MGAPAALPILTGFTAVPTCECPNTLQSLLKAMEPLLALVLLSSELLEGCVFHGHTAVDWFLWKMGTFLC